MSVSSAAAVMASCFAVLLLPLRGQESSLAIRARAMVDVERSRLIENATVIVRGGRILAAGSSADVPVPANDLRTLQRVRFVMKRGRVVKPAERR